MDSGQVLQRERGQRGIGVVVKGGAVKLILSPLGGNTDIRRACVFRTEAIGENVHLVDGFKRGLAAGRWPNMPPFERCPSTEKLPP